MSSLSSFVKNGQQLQFPTTVNSSVAAGDLVEIVHPGGQVASVKMIDYAIASAGQILAPTNLTSSSGSTQSVLISTKPLLDKFGNIFIGTTYPDSDAVPYYD